MLAERLNNFSEDNILRLDGLPWCSTEQNIRDFFHGLIFNNNLSFYNATRITSNIFMFFDLGLNIEGVKLVCDELTKNVSEAFVRFSSVEDYDSALKRNWEIMNNRLFLINF